ncbi:hypothetical protein [Nocardiopsis dassonvillei]|uniref:hypothetical protein n=1 Tax=Nocardiopsis dassonvillei TaxID=2014 RepID=UPI0008FC6AA2|nr:hypothetical protein [Nocardiopsis dassonvillei]
MHPRPPKPWFLVSSVIIVISSGAWLVFGRPSGWLAFAAWDVLITWLVCLGLATHEYRKARSIHSTHQAASEPEEEPTP